MIHRVGVVVKPNPDPERVKPALSSLLAWLKTHSQTVIITPNAAEFATSEFVVMRVEELVDNVALIVALGGDGTLLSIARKTASLSLPILAVNLGGLGFITEVKVEEMLPTLDLILADNFRTEKRMMIEITHTENGIAKNCCNGLNEVVVNKKNISRLIDLDVFVDDVYVTSYSADGLIVATPTGSTAYSLSAGGPIVHPSHNAFIITPICPHTLTNRPLIVDSSSVIKIVNSSDENAVNLTIDGQVPFNLSPQGEVRVKRSEHNLTLVVSPYNDYFAVLREKLRWSGRP